MALDLRRGAARSRPLLGDLKGADLVAEEEAFLGSHIRALLVALADKDTYTEEHTRRVALRAVQIGDELGLAPERLRDLALGGLLHDIGKLSVPDEILKKPGALTEDEFAEVKRHVVSGVALLHELGGFSAMVHQLVGNHHERLDGSGYPDGARAWALSLDVRILAVCDVYDALISTRVYRERVVARARDCASPRRVRQCVRRGLRRGARARAGARAERRPRGRRLARSSSRRLARRYARYGCGSIGPPTTRSTVSAGVSFLPSE